MRKIIQEKLFFVFRDADGILGFTIKSYDGEPINPRFLFDGEKQLFLLRRPGQVICLDSVGEEFVSALLSSEKVRFLETPEDSSEIVRQYDIVVTKIETILLSDCQMVCSEENVLVELSHSA